MRIRAARATDALAISRLRVGSQQAAYRGILPDEHLDALRVRDGIRPFVLLLRSKRATTLVAVERRAVVGYLTVGPALSGDPEEQGWGELWIGAIRRDRWGGGIGRRLWLAAIAELPQETTFGWMCEADDSSRRFHRTLGYVEDGSTKVQHFKMREGGPDRFPVMMVRMRRESAGRGR